MHTWPERGYAAFDGTIETQDGCEDFGGVYQGDGSSCDAVFCSQGACCFPDGTCEIIGTGPDCEEVGGEYQGDQSTCDVGCEPPSGACCFEDGSCADLRQAACVTKGGLYQGDFTECAGADCPPQKFACCLPGDACGVFEEEQCLDKGGAVQDAETCVDVDCASTRSYTSTIETRAITDTKATVITIDVPDRGTIASIKSVDLLSLSHTWAGDVTITLEHAGVTVTLLDRPGVPESSFGDSADFDGSVYVWSDGGFVYDADEFDGTVPSDMAYGLIPPTAFADFVGLDKFGPWTLTITDSAAGDDGAIDGFRLSLNNGEPVTICSGDIAGAGNAPDGVIDFIDLLTLVGNWGACDRCPADLDGDGDVDFVDLVTLLGGVGAV